MIGKFRNLFRSLPRLDNKNEKKVINNNSYNPLSFLKNLFNRKN